MKQTELDSPRFSFSAPLLDPGGPGAYVEVPLDIEALFGKKRLKIQALIAGHPYRGSMVRMGGPAHVLIVLKEIRQKAGLAFGDLVEVTFWEDLDERVIELPVELEKALASDQRLREIFDGMSFTHRREWAMYVSEAKQEQTRQRRAQKVLEELRKNSPNV